MSDCNHFGSEVLMRIPHLTLAALVALGAPVQAQTPSPYVALPSVTLPQHLDQVLRDYERAWEAGDEAALAGLFTADGFVPTGRGWVRGREAIQHTYQNSDGALRLRALAFAVQDSVGYIVGGYRYGDAPAPDTGKFILALRRTPGGAWLIAADLDQSNRSQPD